MKSKLKMLTLSLAVLVAGRVYPELPDQKPDQSAQDISEEMKLIRARINLLETRQREAALKAEENRTREQVILDSEKHSQLLDPGAFTAGRKDGRFFLGSEDGSFSLRPLFQIQFRDVTVERDHFKPGGDSDTQSGFEVRRMRMVFDGNAFTPDLTYAFIWGSQRASGNANVNNTATPPAKIGTTSNNLGGSVLLEEAWAKYHIPNSPFYVRAGQIRDPLLHDQIIGTIKQQAVERQISSDIFANGEGFTEAATFIYDPKTWVRTEAGINHGLRSADTNFLDYPNSNAFNFGAVARGEFKVMGRWQDYNQIGAVDVKEPLLVIGVAADYSERGHSGQTVGVLDAMYADPNGLSVYGGLIDRYTNHNFGYYQPTVAGTNLTAPPATVLNKPTNEYAGFIQVGYLINQKWEPYGRFEYIHVAGTPAGSHNYIPAVAGGLNYYFYGHQCKLTGQVQYLPQGIPFDDTPNDVLAQPSGKGEISAELQFQLVI